MKKVINNVYDFIQQFEDMGRGKQYSVYGFKALYEYLTEIEEQCDFEIDLDVIEICCQYAEYETPQEALQAYSNLLYDHDEHIDIDDLTDEEAMRLCYEIFSNQLSIIEVYKGGVIIEEV